MTNPEQATNDTFIYLLSYGQYRDSIILDRCATNEEGIKDILVEEAAEMGQKVIKESIEINHESETINYKYLDYSEEEEEGVFYIFKVKVK